MNRVMERNRYPQLPFGTSVSWPQNIMSQSLRCLPLRRDRRHDLPLYYGYIREPFQLSTFFVVSEEQELGYMTALMREKS